MIKARPDLVGSSLPVELQDGVDRLHVPFGEGGDEVFEQRFPRLTKSRTEKAFKALVVGAVGFSDLQDGGVDFGGRIERLGRDEETDFRFPGRPGQDREGRKVPLSLPGGELLGDLFLHHGQYGPAQGVFQGLEEDGGGDVVGEVGHQPIGAVAQASLLPALQHISALQSESAVGDLSGELLRQIPAQPRIHFIRRDATDADELFG